IGRSLEDIIIEPLRSNLIPEFGTIKRKCIEAGALGGGISGSGPSIFMLSKDAQTAGEVETIMKDVYNAISLHHYTYVTSVNHQGCTILEHE
ncbi:MAG TPA: homoserine kinase, partial [Flavisolibacter sp.]